MISEAAGSLLKLASEPDGLDGDGFLRACEQLEDIGWLWFRKSDHRFYITDHGARILAEWEKANAHK